MKIKVVKENSILPVGSVAYVVKVYKTTYRILHASMMGSYHYSIPKKYVKIRRKK